MLAYFAMMLVEKHRTCRSIFVDVVALYRAGLRGYHGTLLLLVALTVWGYGATTLRCYYFLRHCISRSLPCWGTGATTVRCSFITQLIVNTLS